MLKRNGKPKWESNLRLLLCRMHIKVWCVEYNAVKRAEDAVIASFLPSCPTRSRFPFTSTSCCCPETTAALQWHVLAYVQDVPQ